MPQTAPTPHIHLIAVDDIDATALPRDRTTLDETALAELQASILSLGLTHPVEVWQKSDPQGGPRYGLISGLRRLTVYQSLAPSPNHAMIPAFLRAPSDIAEAMTRMVAENEIRAPVSPWEKGRLVADAVEEGLFDTLDAATDRLFHTLDRNRRARLRAVAEVAMELGDDAFSDPRALSFRQLTRVAFALRHGFGDLINATLAEAPNAAPDAQWKRLAPVLAEAEEEARTPDTGPKYRPGRPRRRVAPRRNLRIRRERTAEGWALRFTGLEATGPLMEDIMDHIEREFGQSG